MLGFLQKDCYVLLLYQHSALIPSLSKVCADGSSLSALSGHLINGLDMIGQG